MDQFQQRKQRAEHVVGKPLLFLFRVLRLQQSWVDSSDTLLCGLGTHKIPVLLNMSCEGLRYRAVLQMSRQGTCGMSCGAGSTDVSTRGRFYRCLDKGHVRCLDKGQVLQMSRCPVRACAICHPQQGVLPSSTRGYGAKLLPPGLSRNAAVEFQLFLCSYSSDITQNHKLLSLDSRISFWVKHFLLRLHLLNVVIIIFCRSFGFQFHVLPGLFLYVLDRL